MAGAGTETYDNLLANTRETETVWKLLLQKDIDPLNYNTIHRSFVSNILENCAVDPSNFQEWLNILNYILCLPEINENISGKKHEIYDGIFKYLFEIGELYDHYYPEHTENLQKLLKRLYESNRDILFMRFHHQLPKQKGLELSTDRMFGLLGHVIATAMEGYDYGGFKCMIVPFLHNICDVLFSIPDFRIEQEGCISPLTVFVLSTYTLALDLDVEDRNWDGQGDMIYNDFDYFIWDNQEIEERVSFFGLSIEKGCHVNAMDIQISETYVNEMKQRLQVPDALLVSLLVNNKKYVELLLQHWWGPPLSLLLFCRRWKNIAFWLPFLLQYDTVPTGSTLYQELHSHLMRFGEEMLRSFEEARDPWQQYQKCRSQPSSLQSMCKYAIRQHLAIRVSRDTRLPDLLTHTSIPPLLSAVLLQ